MPDWYYLLQLPTVISALTRPTEGNAPPSVEVHIMSEGKAAWSSIRGQYKAALNVVGASAVHFHLDTDVFHTLAHLIEADVLVLGPSSYSLLASHYSLGVQLIPGTKWMMDTHVHHRKAGHLFPHYHMLPPVHACSCYDKAIVRQITPNVSNLDKWSPSHNCFLRCNPGLPPIPKRAPKLASHLACTCTAFKCVWRNFTTHTFRCDVDALLYVKRAAEARMLLAQPHSLYPTATWKPLWRPLLSVSDA